MDSQLDPLKNTDVQRVLSFARARELYPALSRADLRECCHAAWAAACAERDGGDLTQRFDRALVLVVWARRGSRTRISLDTLVDQTIPRIALEPFLSRATAPAAPIEPPVTAPPRAPDRSAREPGTPRRMPFASPIPVGGAVAAGALGVAMLGATEGLPVTPLSPASSDDDGGERADRGGEPAAPEAAAPVPAPASEPAPLAPALGWGGLDGLANAAAGAGEAQAPGARAVERASVASGKGADEESVSDVVATESAPVADPEPVAAPAPEPVVAPQAVPEPSITATGPAAPAAIQIRRPEPPMLAEVRAPVDERPEDEGGDSGSGEDSRPDLTEPDAVEGALEDPESIEDAIEAAGEGIEPVEELTEQGAEVAPPVAEVAPPEVPPVAETVPPVDPATEPVPPEMVPPEPVPPEPAAELSPPPADSEPAP